MGGSVPKCKRSAYVLDNDFIVVDDITGFKKLRSECAIDGYGFLSANGNARNPQEIPPIINEQMAAWPDPRPVSPTIYTPSPDYQYFIFNYEATNGFCNDDMACSGEITLDATLSFGLNSPISEIEWSIDGVYAATGFIVDLVIASDGDYTITTTLTDTYNNIQSFDFTFNLIDALDALDLLC